MSNQNSNSEGEVLRFQPFSSAATVDFWKELARKKLNTYKLDDSPQDIVGWYSPDVRGDARIPSRLKVTEHSFLNSSEQELLQITLMERKMCRVFGTLRNFNTVDEFKAADKSDILKKETSDIWCAIHSGEVVKHPELMLKFHLLSFADLKKNSFLYWFCFPALSSPRPFQVKGRPHTFASTYSSQALNDLHAGVSSLHQEIIQAGGCGLPYFIVYTSHSSSTKAEGHNPKMQVVPLTRWEDSEQEGGLTSQERENALFGFLDPCSLPQYPGWPLRNFLMLLCARWGLTHARILAYRGPLQLTEAYLSRTNELPPGEGYVEEDTADATFVTIVPPVKSSPNGQSMVFEVLLDGGLCNVLSASMSTPMPPCPQNPVGWELNKHAKTGPRFVDLSGVLDPTKLMSMAVDLNLKLMRWRALPRLDCESLAQLRCLILGSGTLGCGVVRTLLGWGVRKFEMVDNGRVSYTNPVRQSLFTFQNCKDGGQLKAEAACEAMKNIFPMVEANPHNLTIPMPGHILSTPQEVELAERDYQKLMELCEACDVIFVLTDTRESRWLPSLIAASKNKILLSASLGMDSYLVLRQGNGLGAQEDVHLEQHTKRLGCYFCNDVVAPENSTRNRTLDQQCTVTRPGVAPIAASLAVELLIALLHTPERQYTPAAPSSDISNLPCRETRPLGIVPHQVRGFLTHFSTIVLESPAFQYCSACSPAVVQQFRTLGFGFIFQVCNSPGYLEKLTGLADLQKKVEEIDIEWEDEEFQEDA